MTPETAAGQGLIQGRGHLNARAALRTIGQDTQALMLPRHSPPLVSPDSAACAAGQ